MTTRPTTPIKMFCSYADADEKLQEELEKHLSPLMREGKISVWHNRKIMPGKERAGEIDEHLNSAQIILLLVSSDFIDSDYCYDIEMQRAIDRHSTGEARVIPIILRPVVWHDTLFGKLQALPNNGKPVSSWHNTDEALFEVASEIHRVIDEFLKKNATLPKNKRTLVETVHNREDKLQALDSSNKDFIQNLLKNFNGREQDLIEIRRRIAEIQPAGGYIAIIGAAGQGKSSIIAKLVKEYESENVASHFILFNSGPDYQITLLKRLMAHLIRKYRFSDLYIATESLPALHEYFSIILRKIAERSGHEVIFIDGFEQSEEMQAEMYDISFLPHNPPPGIVLVLGIRSENTLKFFEISKPHHEYHLPHLNRPDFESILQRHHIQLEREQVNQLYHATHGNPLYLNLTIEELKTQGIAAIGEIFVLITNHLENLYALAVTRLEQPHEEWDKVLKPLLGVFMVAREPLSEQSICQILNIEVDRLKIGLRRLDRLVVKNSQKRYALFHSEIHKYLHRDKRFSALEWHKKFAEWCEGDSITTIWKDSNDLIEQQRQVYARQHYITHLYYARDQLGIFQVLDVGEYGQAKIQYLDLGSILYTRDLDLGKHASVWKSRIGEEQGRTLNDQITQLPHLWRYSLLRCSLINGERQYPDGVFRLLVLLKREKEALQLAELFTDPILKAEALLAIAKQMLKQPELGSECLNILTRAYTVVDAIKENIYQCSAILLELGQILTQAQEWERAKSVWDVKSPWDKVEQMIDPPKDHEQRDKALWKLGWIMAQVRQWTRARQVIDKIHDRKQKVHALLELGRALAREQELVRAKTIWGDARSEIGYIRDSEQQSKVLRELGQRFTLSGLWDEAEQVIDTIRNNKQRIEALRELGRALAQEQKWERAETVWGKAKQAMEAPQDIAQRVKVLNELGRALTQAQHRERAEAVWDEAERLVNILQGSEQVEALLELGKALAQTFWVKTSQVKDTDRDNEHQVGSLANQKIQGHVQQEIVQTVDDKIEQEKERSKAVWQRAEQAIKKIQYNERFNEASWELGDIYIYAQEWRKARQVITNIKNDEQKTEALLKLGQILIQEQVLILARDVLVEAGKLVSTIQDGKQRDTLLKKLVNALVQAEEWSEAKLAIGTIQDSEQKDTARTELARALVQAKEWSEAKFAIGNIQDSEQKAEIRYELARKLMQIQKWDEAEQVIDNQGSKQEIDALRELGRVLAQAGLWERAETIWGKAKQAKETPQDIAQRVKVLSELGRALTQAQQEKRANAAWDEAERLVNTLPEAEKYEALLELSKALAQSQRKERADKIIHLISEKQLVEAPLALLQVLIQAQQWDQAQSIIDGLKEREGHAEAVLDLVRGLVASKRWRHAERAIKDIDIEKDEKQYTEAVRVLWKAFIQEQQWEKAQQLIETIQDTEQRAEALCELGEALAQAKQKKQAETIWTKIQRSMKTSQDSEPRDEVIYMLAQALSQKQQWDETRQVIDSIQDIEWKIEAFYMLAQALTNAEQFEQAQNIWDDVEQAVTNIPDLNQRNTAAKDFVHALTVTHQWERAERIAGMIGDGEQRNEALEELEEAKKLSNTSQDEEYEASQELEGVENREQIRPFQEKAEETKDTIEDPEKHIQVLSDLKLRNIRAQQREQVEELSGRRQRDRQKNIFLDKLARALQTQQWEQAEQVIESFLDDRQKNTALGELAGALAQAQQWKQAEQVINRIPNNKQRNAALNELGTILATTNEFEELLHLVQRTWLQIETREDAIALLPLAVGLISLEPDIGIEFCKAFDWVDDFLVG